MIGHNRAFKPYRYDRRQRRSPQPWLLGITIVLLAAISYQVGVGNQTRPTLLAPGVTQHRLDPGAILSVESTRTYTASETLAAAKQNYGATALPPETGATKIVFRYRSYDLDGTPIVIYGRAYLPSGRGNLPIFAFAPGTTGIGDQCAGTLEQPALVNWGNYDSHMLMYASQGYATVITDYEGMRDPKRLHHYMVGALEGRAVLDSIRALQNLVQTRGRLDPSTIFVGGYSQGGHAAFWADKIAADYAPTIKIRGVVGWGPVMDVRETIGDVTLGANINWFGPYVLTSYADYYHRQYDLGTILQPNWVPQLAKQVQAHCIDSVIPFWGRVPDKVYQPSFLSAIHSADFATKFPELALDLERNVADDAATPSAKLINEGAHDNVVLPLQQSSVFPTLCRRSLGVVSLKTYEATHYDDMVVSLKDTLAWMANLKLGNKPLSTCPPSI